jgi:putative membrane protein
MANIVKNLVVALKGYAMGAANVIPGVSGGTIALLTGIFNELIEALNAILSVSSWKLLLKGDFKESWKAIHGTFLLWLAIGVIISVFSLAKLMG